MKKGSLHPLPPALAVVVYTAEDGEKNKVSLSPLTYSASEFGCVLSPAGNGERGERRRREVLCSIKWSFFTPSLAARLRFIAVND